MKRNSFPFFVLVFALVFSQTQAFAKTPSSPDSPKEAETQASTTQTEDPVSKSHFSKLSEISLESSSDQVRIRIAGTGGFLQAHEEKLVNPGRLILEIPNIENATNLNINQLTDHLIIPRVRLAQHPEKMRIIVDTVLMHLPLYDLQKTDHEITLIFQKTADLAAEAKTKAELFLAMQRGDREALLKMGSEDDGGILFAEQNASSSQLAGGESVKDGEVSGVPGVRVTGGGVASPGASNRVVFLLDDRREYKIYVQETQTPIHIEKIRPVYEVRGIQTRLSKLGYELGEEDGAVGPHTREALRQFQEKHGLPVSGNPNKKTQATLKKEFGY